MPFSERKDYFAKQILITAALIPLFFVLCTIPSPSALAATVNLAWDPSTGSNIAGYKIYYGTASKNYSSSVNVGKNTNGSVPGLTEGKKYYFAATAYNTSNTESAKSSELSYTIPAASSSGTSTSTSSGTSGSSSTVIIDNGASGTKSTGTWSTSSGSGYYGSKSVFSKTVSASYSFEATRSGSQQVYLWWTTHASRYSAVPVQIYDGSTLKATVNVNQLQNGGKWNLLGTYSFSGQAKVVIVSKSSSQTTCADAVQFSPTTTTSSGSTSTGSSSTIGSTTGSSGTTGSTSSTVPTGSTSTSTSSGTSGSSSTVIIDNGASGTKSTGTWSTSSGSGYYGSKSVFSKTVSASYSFEATRSGSQQVYLWWTTHDSRYSDVPVNIYDGSTLKDTITVNQLQNGGKWNLLGTYSFSGQAKVVIVSKSSSQTTCADAVKFVPTSTTTSSPPSGTSASSGSIIIDNGDSGTKAAGSWKVSGGSGFYGSNSVFSDTASSTYSFETACSGPQEIYLWWSNHSSRCTAVPVEIYDGTTYLDTVNVNQRKNSGQWNELGTFSFSGKAKVVIISNGGGCTTSADAVNFFEPN